MSRYRCPVDERHALFFAGIFDRVTIELPFLRRSGPFCLCWMFFSSSIAMAHFPVGTKTPTCLQLSRSIDRLIPFRNECHAVPSSKFNRLKGNIVLCRILSRARKLSQRRSDEKVSYVVFLDFVS